MFLGIATLLFAAYVGNVLLGALAGAPVIGDVSEMIVLFCASAAFTVAILKREAAAKDTTNKK